MFSQTPNVYGVRTRKQRSALAAANEAERVPGSTLGTMHSAAEDSSAAESGPAKKATHADVPANRSRGATPDLDISAYELDPPDAGSLSPGRGNTSSPVETSQTERQTETLSHWIRENPNIAEYDEGHTPVARMPLRRSRSQDSPRLRVPLLALNRAPATLSALEPALPITSRTPHVPTVINSIRQAEYALRPADRENISRRYAKVQVVPEQTDHSVLSQEEGPSSKRKGKTVDPRNWGNLSLASEELNQTAQQELFNAFKPRTNFIKPRQREQRPSTPVRERSSRPRTREPTARPEDSRPIDQLPLTSYLARTLENMERLRTRNMPHDHSDPSSSDSSSDDYGHGRDPLRAKNKSRHARKSKSRDKRRDKKTTLKPIVPKEYGGAADACLFYRFVTEGTAYVIDGCVALDRQVFVLSYYLSGPAYDFYTQKVSMNFFEWTLSAFFEALFNYCFPVNYRMVQRDKLKRAFQNDKSVAAYVHELEELFNLIGSNDEREHVIKLWNGL
jgi:hypothetical protein